MTILDHEEEEILLAFEAGKLQPAQDRQEAILRHKEYAENTFKKDRRITIRISGRDLDALQVRALQEGIPYQTLIASVLHKYVDGRLVEKPAR